MGLGLQALDFRVRATKETSALIPVHGCRRGLTLAEFAAVREAASIPELDYVYFRRFADGRSPQVAAYVIDNSNEKRDRATLARVHHQVWLNGVAPLLYIEWPTSVDVLSCARGPDFWEGNKTEYQPAVQIPTNGLTYNESIVTASRVSRALELRRRFSALRLSDGTFWDDPRNSGLARAEKAAHRLLIDAVVATDEAIAGERRPVLRRLLLLIVLIKYLEDRRVFPSRWFDKFHKGANNFFEVLRHGTPSEVRDLLATLEKKFNGAIFTLPESRNETLSTADLRNFATLVEARTIRKQNYLWQMYSFEHLPVEVISHLYQRFASRGKGAIYTPPFVAALLLDYALPYDAMSGNERVLDPTCGSGVFLVGAFRRLVNHWRSRNGWRSPDVSSLKAILRNSVFGVELQPEALHLASISLALAICDALKPKVIWKELRLDKLLGTNLFDGDFFDFLQNAEPRYDVVVGNPPFLSKLTSAGARINAQAAKVRGPLPDRQVAYLVAEQAISLLNATGRVCLIQPSSLLYNENSRTFHQRLLTEHQADHILDFTSIRGLFDEADTKIMALVARKARPHPTHEIVHLTFRRTFSVEEEIAFELDHYDRHIIRQSHLIDMPSVWKVNLLGGGRLHQFVRRLRSEGTTLIQFIHKNGWDAGEGFIVGNKANRVDWLTGKRYLPSTALTEKGIDDSRIGRVTETHFEAPRTKFRYTPPLMLIRENERLSCAFWDDGFLAYRAQVVGIRAPQSARDSLFAFYDSFRSQRSMMRALCLLTGTRVLAGKATAINKTDIDNIPWPRDGAAWELAPWERVLCEDVVTAMPEYIRLGQASRLLKERASASDLKQYSEVYRDMLGTVYRNLRIGTHVALNGLICQLFPFGDAPAFRSSGDWEKLLRELVYVRGGAAIRTMRVLRFYQKNTIFIVKPDRLRYWIRSTAIRDADETVADLRRQGY